MVAALTQLDPTVSRSPVPLDRSCLAAAVAILAAAPPAFAQATKPPIGEVAQRLPAELFGMKRIKLDQSAPDKGEGLQALYQGKTGRATVLLEPRGEAPLADGIASPGLEAEVKRVTEADAKHVVSALGPRYWQAEPKVKRLNEKKTGMALLCGEIERRAGNQKKTPEQVRMVNLGCVTGAAGRLLTVMVTTPFKGKVESSARKAQDYFVMAIAQAVAGKATP
jgi:hypothetical protein